MKITLELLDRLNACSRERRRFAALYPDGVELTVQNMRDARGHHLSVGWLVCRVPLEKYDWIHAEAEKKHDPDDYIRVWFESVVTVFDALDPNDLQPALKANRA